MDETSAPVAAQPQVVLRPEEFEDCRVVAAAHIATWQAGYVGILPDELLASHDLDRRTQRRQERFTSEHGQSTLVAELDGHIIGHVSFGPYQETASATVDPAITDAGGSEIGEIGALYVHPDHWGVGVGARLLHAALAALPQPVVRLWVLELNHRGRRFFVRHGFAPDGARGLFRPDGIGEGYPEIRYSRHR